MRISDWSSDVCSSDLIEHGACGGQQVIAAASLGKQRQSVEDFRLRQRRREYARHRLLGNPRHDPRVRLAPHQLGNGVRVENNHSPKSTARIGSRYSSGRSTPPSAPNLSRSEENTSELQYLMRISYDIF